MATAGMNHYNNNDEAPSAAVEADSDSETTAVAQLLTQNHGDISHGFSEILSTVSRCSADGMSRRPTEGGGVQVSVKEAGDC